MATIPHPNEPTLDIREQIARIDRTQAELARIQAEINKWQADAIRSRHRDQAEIDKWQTDAQKTKAETAKIDRDTRLAPWSMILTVLGAASAFFAAGAAFMKLVAG